MTRTFIIKGGVLLAVLGGLVFLFFQTVRDAASEPYTVRAELLADWTVTLEGPRDPLGALLSLRPPPELPMLLSQQIFRRHTESMMAPAVRSIPLVLREEFEAALGGVLSPAALAEAAERADVRAGLEPACMAAQRRAGAREPGRIFFVLFEGPGFVRFREGIAEMLAAREAPAAGYDPAALSPLLVVAASDRSFEAWLPRRADREACIAPIAIE